MLADLGEGGPLGPLRWAVLLCVACVARPKHVALQAEHLELQSRVDAVEVRAKEQKRDLHLVRENALEDQLAAERVTERLMKREQENQQLSDTIVGLEKNQEGVDVWTRSVRERLRRMVEVGTLTVTQTEDRLIVELPNDVLFSPGSARVAQEGRATLASVASALASLEGREILVSGHTDATPIHNEEFENNWVLGAARAIAVVQMLIDEGLPAAQVGAASYGSNRPLDSNKTPEGRRANRRIEIAILPDLAIMDDVEIETESQ